MSLFCKGLSQKTDTTDLVIKGSSITIKSGTKLYINGSLENHFNNYSQDLSPKGFINNMGQIYLRNNLFHNINGSELFLSDTTGTIILYKDYVQYFYGNILNLNNLHLDKSKNYLVLNTDVNINGTLNFISGYIDIRSKIINLGSSGKLKNESEVRCILGNKGYIEATNRMLSSSDYSNIAGLGLELKFRDINPGSIKIRRKFTSQYRVTDGSLTRYYDVFSTTSTSVDMRFNYFDYESRFIKGRVNKVDFRIWESEDTESEQSGNYSLVEGELNLSDRIIVSENVGISNLGKRFTVAEINCDNPPFIPFSDDPLALCVGDTIELNAGNPGCSYLWKHNQSTEPKVRISQKDINDNQGEFFVTVTDSLGCFSSKAQKVELHVLPDVDFKFESSYCQGDNVVFRNISEIDSNELLKYEWKFHDGSVKHVMNATKVYNDYGNFEITLTAESAAGCISSRKKSVNILPSPEANFNIDKDSVCLGGFIQLVNISDVITGSIYKSFWDFGDGFTSEFNNDASLNGEIKLYENTGTYNVSLKVISNGNCADSYSQEIEVLPVPDADFTVENFFVNQPTIFNNRTSENSAVDVEYRWDFGDGDYSTDESCEHIYKSVGKHNISLIATSEGNCVSDKQREITILGVPKSLFEVSSGEVCFGDTVSFINKSSIEGDTRLEYLWEFGDGTKSVESNPKYVFKSDGLHITKLTVKSNSGLTDSYSKVLVVNPRPEVKYVINDFCQGEELQIRNNTKLSKGNLNFRWSFGNGEFSNEESPVISYQSYGRYEIALNATSDKGCSSDLSKYVNVFEKPISEFKFEDVCFGDVVTFDNRSTISEGELSYNWVLGDGNRSDEKEFSYLFKSSGCYNVTLYVESKNNCSSVYSSDVTIFPKPVSKFSTENACIGSEIKFNNQSSLENGQIMYNWDFGNGKFSEDENPVIEFSAPGTYSVKLFTVSDKNCKDTTSGFTEIYPMPELEFEFEDVCFGEQSIFKNRSTIKALVEDSELKFLWSFGDGSKSSNREPVYTYSYPGVYQVNLLAESKYGCSQNLSKSTVVLKNPKPDFTVDNVCVGELLELKNNTVSYNGEISYDWKFDGKGSSTENLPEYSFTSEGEKLISLNVVDEEGCKGSLSMVSEVYPTPNIDIQINPSFCENEYMQIADKSSISRGDLTYLWDFGDGYISSNRNILTHKYENHGDYNLKLSVESEKGCMSSLTRDIYVKESPEVLFSVDNTTPGESINFTPDVNFSGQKGFIYNWIFGDGSSSKHSSPVHVYESPGIFELELEVTAENGCKGIFENSLKIDYAPVADFEIKGNQYEGEVLYFINKSLVSKFQNVEYHWDINGEDKYYIQNPEHRFIKRGNYTVTLIAKYGSGRSNSVSKNIEIINRPDTPSNDTKPDLGDDIVICDSDLPYKLKCYNISNGLVWSNGNTGSSIEITKGGTYWVRTENSNGLEASDTINVEVKPMPVLKFSDTIHSCVGEKVTLDANNPGANYMWSTKEDTKTVDVETSGRYWVNVYYDKECPILGQTVVVFHDKLQLDLGKDKSVCIMKGEDISIESPEGLKSYLWNSGEATSKISVSESGYYWLEVEDIYGCKARDTISIDLNITNEFDIGDTLKLCRGDSSRIEADFEALSYRWSNGYKSSYILVDSPEIIWLEATDNSGCVYRDSVLVIQQNTPSVYLGEDREICEGSTVELIAPMSPKYTYLWSDGTTSNKIYADKQGDYWVRVSLPNGCFDADSVNIRVNSLPEKVFDNRIKACDSIILDAANYMSEYMWSTGSTNRSIEVSKSGKYVVMITNSHNCSIKDSVDVDVFNSPKVDLGANIERCEGEDIVLNARNEGAGFIWSDNTFNQVKSIAKSDRYWVKVTDENGCYSFDTVKVKIKSVPEFDLGSDVHICRGEDIVINPGIDASDFAWSTGEIKQQITVSESGKYTLKAMSDNGCSFIDDVNVYVHEIPKIYLGKDTIACGSVKLNAGSSEYKYLWSTGETSPFIDVKKSGFYSVTKTDDYNCSISSDIVVDIGSVPSIIIDCEKSYCDGDTATLTVESDVENVYWKEYNKPTISITESGIYKAKAEGLAGCESEKEIEIEFYPKPSVDLGEDITLCEGSIIELEAENESAVYNWGSDNNFTSSDRFVSISGKGKYWLDVTNNYNCKSTDTLLVNELSNNLEARALFPSLVDTGDSLLFVNVSSPLPYKSYWSFGDGVTDTSRHPMHVYYIDGEFTVKLKVDNGICDAKMEKKVKVNESLKSSNAGLVADSLKQKNRSLIKTIIAYPNPGNGIFVVESELLVESDIFIDIYSYSGFRILLEKFSDQKLFHRLYNLEYLPSGIYFIRIIARGEMKVFKIIKV